MRRSHGRARTGVALVLALAVAGCASSGESGDAAPAPESTPAAAVAPDARAGESGAETAKPLAELEKQFAETPGTPQQKFEAVKAGYEAFAAAHPGTEEGLTAKLFLLQNTWWEREKGTMNASAGKLAEEIVAGWPKSPQLLRLVESQHVLSLKSKRGIFEKLSAESPHDAVKAEALLALGRIDIGSTDAAKQAVGRARFEELSKKYGELKRRGITPYSEIAEASLSPHAAADLAVGKPAPEIVGRDLDGKPMKLSDFRGKVVVLDFWGDW